VSTYTAFADVGDEPAHLACGLEYLARHVYRYESQHPPLARAMAALGPYLDGARPVGEPNPEWEGDAILCHSAYPGRTLFLARLGVLPFFLLACLVIYFWARHHFGNSAAVFATGLFTLLPPVLAHAGLATTDMALTACLGAAFFSLVLWAEKPTLPRTLLLGAAAALAALSKFTALGFLPAGVALALVAYIAVERPGLNKLAALARERAAPFGLAVLAGALLIWAGYWFSFGPVPAPEFFDGIRNAIHHNATGHTAYLLGQVSKTGWWYFFPVALAVKTPIAFLLLLAWGAYLCWQNRRKVAYLLPLAFSLGILLPAMTSHVNIGVRHILPIYIGFSIMAGRAGAFACQLHRKPAAIVLVLLLLWLALTGAIHHPDYLSYFNELVGSQPEKVLVDSDLDWRQDAKRLAQRLKDLGATQVSFGQFIWKAQCLDVWPGLPHPQAINPLVPVEGWTAVSPTLAKTTQYGMDYRFPNLQPWFEYIQPVERVGSLLLYYVPPGTLRQAR
jgi:4-amino-4-deoxy-L-arabinose transferase-like glycosyltransferase